MKTFRLIFLLLVSIPAVHAETIHIGILSFQPKAVANQKWAALGQYLHTKLPDHQFVISAETYSELNESILTHKFDFVLTNPGHYIITRDKHLLSQATASLLNYVEGKPSPFFGGVIFTLSSKQSVMSLHDLASSTIASPADESLGGYQMQAYELQQMGTNTAKLRMHWTGMPHDKVVRAVLNNEADVGFVRTGVIERMVASGVIRREQIRILNPKTYPNFSQLISTPLYPEWAFVPSLGIDRELVRQVTLALLDIASDKTVTTRLGIAGFDATYDYSGVRNVLMTLALPPYDSVKSVVIANTWRDNKLAILILITSIVTLILLVLLLVFGYQKNRRLSSQLETLSITDPLTGVHNRRYFDEQLRKQVSVSARHDSSLSLIILDIDHFKRINDDFGHQTGDHILTDVASMLEGMMRRSDFLARYGGEEFAIISIGSPLTDAVLMAERILNRIEVTTFEYDSIPHRLTISAGVAAWKESMGNDVDKLIQAADEALYRAKHQGRNRVCACVDAECAQEITVNKPSIST